MTQVSALLPLLKGEDPNHHPADRIAVHAYVMRLHPQCLGRRTGRQGRIPIACWAITTADGGFLAIGPQVGRPIYYVTVMMSCAPRQERKPVPQQAWPRNVANRSRCAMRIGGQAAHKGTSNWCTCIIHGCWPACRFQIGPHQRPCCTASFWRSRAPRAPDSVGVAREQRASRCDSLEYPWRRRFCFTGMLSAICLPRGSQTPGCSSTRCSMHADRRR